jgi:hypothetical protein
MDVVEFPWKCQVCGDAIGLADVDPCLFCDRVMCGRHLTRQAGITSCADCEGERRARLAEAVITEADQERLLIRISRDLEATVGPAATPIALEASGRQRLFADSLDDYERRVIEDVQQGVHDDFVDTTWPACPHHPNHPLWYSEGWWRCDRAGAIARLGELAGVRRPSV